MLDLNVDVHVHVHVRAHAVDDARVHAYGVGVDGGPARPSDNARGGDGLPDGGICELGGVLPEYNARGRARIRVLVQYNDHATDVPVDALESMARPSSDGAQEQAANSGNAA